jgi:hypothetical protein
MDAMTSYGLRLGRSSTFRKAYQAQSNLVSVRLETMLVSVQDRCIVYTKCTIGSGIILDAPNGTPT